MRKSPANFLVSPILIVVFLSIAAIAAEMKTTIDVPPLTARVNDAAGLLSPAAAAALNEKLAAYEMSTTNQFVLLTVPSLQGDALESFSLRVAEAWKIGRKRVDNGVILVVVKDEHKIRIEVGYGLEASLTDAVSSRVISGTIAPRFRDGDFEGGIAAGFEALMKAAEHPAALPEKPEGRRVGGWIVLILLFAAGYGFAGLMAYGGLFSRGGGVPIYIFVGTGLGLAGSFLSEQGTFLGFWIFFVFLIGFPILKLILPRTAWGQGRIIKSASAAKIYRGSHSSSVRWSSGSPHSSGSSGSGGFSGGGGRFGGGGASGSW
jgi:uncharacterized protein